jgi:Type II secretion system (T2SS), protein N
MPPSRSPGRTAKPVQPARFPWAVLFIGAAALAAVIIAVLPASIVTHFLPPSVHADNFSGSIWHGSAGKFSVNARDAGALEWRMHPAALLGMTVAADLRWVNVGFVLEGAASIGRHGFTARDIKGGGPIEDLRNLGLAADWRGTAIVNLSELKSDFVALQSVVGEIDVANLRAAQLANGADMGSYALKLPEGAAGSDGNVTAQLADTGGPLELRAVIHYATRERAGQLTGTLRERTQLPAALQTQLQNLSQLRGRDPQGRIPVDLEFAL